MRILEPKGAITFEKVKPRETLSRLIFLTVFVEHSSAQTTDNLSEKNNNNLESHIHHYLSPMVDTTVPTK